MNKNLVDINISENDKFKYTTDDIPSIIKNIKDNKHSYISNSPLTRSNHPNDEKFLHCLKPGLKYDMNFSDQN